MSTAPEHPWPQQLDAPPPMPPTQPAPPPGFPAAVPHAEQAGFIFKKNPLLAAGLSLFPGVGHIYNGLYMRGITFFLIVISLMLLANSEGVFGFAVGFFWIFNVIDTYRQAVLINYGYAQDLGMLDLPAHPKSSQGGLAAGILLLTVGIFAFLDRFVHIEMEWLIEFWPLALIGIGLWLIVGAIRDRKARAAGQL
jgi:hypothetical protein